MKAFPLCEGHQLERSPGEVLSMLRWWKLVESSSVDHMRWVPSTHTSASAWGRSYRMGDSWSSLGGESGSCLWQHGWPWCGGSTVPFLRLSPQQFSQSQWGGPGRGQKKCLASHPQHLEEVGEWLIGSILLEHAVLLQSDLPDWKMPERHSHTTSLPEGLKSNEGSYPSRHGQHVLIVHRTTWKGWTKIKVSSIMAWWVGKPWIRSWLKSNFYQSSLLKDQWGSISPGSTPLTWQVYHALWHNWT